MQHREELEDCCPGLHRQKRHRLQVPCLWWHGESTSSPGNLPSLSAPSRRFQHWNDIIRAAGAWTGIRRLLDLDHAILAWGWRCHDSSSIARDYLPAVSWVGR